MSGNQLMLAGAPGTVANYIEDVFSTYLYTGTGATQTITNGIDLSTKGGLVWTKSRNQTGSNRFNDTVRGATNALRSNSTDASTVIANGLTAFNTNGYNLGDDSGNSGYNFSALYDYVSWTFREQPKFFDVVTYTGTGSPRTVSHNLGSAPGCIIVKRYDSTGSWAVWHRSGTQTNGKFAAFLNDPGAYADQAENLWGSETVAPDMNASTFGVGTSGSTNSNGFTYVAYLFAHNAGGFGLTGSDNVITCGSYTGNGSTSGPTVTLGYEPQWLMIKTSTTTGSWQMIDNMRGMVVSGDDQRLIANSSSAELTNDYLSPTATGFQLVSTSSEVNGNGQTYIYIAIRRGPMKTPTSGTSVFYPQAVSQADTVDSTNVPFPPDLVNTFSRNGTDRTLGYNQFQFADRLRSLGVPNNTLIGSGCPSLRSSSSFQEATSSYIQLKADGQNITRSNGWNSATYGNWIYYFMRRAPGFFDVVCYTGTSANTTISHNLGVAPELIICKSRSSNPGANWVVWNQTLNSSTGYLYLNDTLEASNFAGVWNGAPTSTYFTLGTNYQNNNSGITFVAYLFATVAGVSKVGSYTGTGTTLQVNCGFTGGSRFVLIKRTDSTGDWYVWDSARGIVASNDPYLLLNSTAAEVTNTDYVDTYSAGFEISSTAPAAINANGGTYIFLAIA
jgi:hypothetical protein